jgi:cobalt-zinc-cadmium efflux system outer membrane protein
MNTRLSLSVVIPALLIAASARAQAPEPAAIAERFVDSANGLSLEQAIAQALEHEPSLRATRSQIDVAQGMREQASLTPNPTLSFERREEPGGPDNQTTIALEWPLDLFRRSKRVAVADREFTAAQLSVADRERLLASDVRMRYGEVLAAVRDLALLDELVAATQRQYELLRSRADEGATPPLERDLLSVEVRRFESERLRQAGRAEAALFELKRVLGIAANAPVTVRDRLDTVVERESAGVTLSAETAKVVEERADVREAAARVELAEAKVSRAESQGRFDVSVFANYMRMDANFPQRAFDDNGSLTPIHGLFNYVSVGATMSIPLLNRNQGEIAAARAERVGAAATHDAARLSAETELAAARSRDEHARRALQVYSSGVQTLARQNLAVIGQSYELGRVTVFDVLAEQRRYLEVERGFTEALRNAFEARTALNRALGELR